MRVSPPPGNGPLASPLNSSQESRAPEYPLEETVRNRFRRGRRLDLFLGDSSLRQQNRTEPTIPIFFNQPCVRAAFPSGGNLARGDLPSCSGPTDYIVPAVSIFIAAGDVRLASEATMDDEISEARERPLVDGIRELALAKGQELRIIIVMDPQYSRLPGVGQQLQDFREWGASKRPS